MTLWYVWECPYSDFIHSYIWNMGSCEAYGYYVSAYCEAVRHETLAKSGFRASFVKGCGKSDQNSDLHQDCKPSKTPEPAKAAVGRSKLCQSPHLVTWQPGAKPCGKSDRKQRKSQEVVGSRRKFGREVLGVDSSTIWMYIFCKKLSANDIYQLLVSISPSFKPSTKTSYKYRTVEALLFFSLRTSKHCFRATVPAGVCLLSCSITVKLRPALSPGSRQVMKPARTGLMLMHMTGKAQLRMLTKAWCSVKLNKCDSAVLCVQLIKQ